MAGGTGILSKMGLTAEALAKVNRELRVGAVRPDGFHEIKSRFVSIDMADTLMAEVSLARIAFTSDDATLPQDERNLVVQAAHLLASILGTAAGARLRLAKRIPAGAGLGGGSSDAAATISVLKRLWEAELSGADVAELAARIGSDVPFFLTGGEAEVTGRGERVRALPDEPPVELMVFVPPFEISTGEVYGAHRSRHEGRGAVPDRLDIETSGRFFGPNELEPAILEVQPTMRTLLETARANAREAAITGSGSAIVLVAPTGEAAARLAAVLPGARFFRTRTVSRDEHRLRSTPFA
jgi:4-diphosphocytidyl-2-C-methyl-D-erythritol kinase